MDCDALKPFLSLAARYIREEDLKLFTGEAAMRMWEDVADKLFDGVKKFTLMYENNHPVLFGCDISADGGWGPPGVAGGTASPGPRPSPGPS